MFYKKTNVEKKNIIMFGAGVLGQITMPQILFQYDLLDLVKCYIDNDSSKWGTNVNIFGREIPVFSPEVLNDYDNDTVILLNISRFSGVLKQLESMECKKDMDCYITGMMCIYNFCSSLSKGSPLLND